MELDRQTEVVVIGGGIAGLVAANAATDNLGPGVTLLDTGAGRARTTDREGVLLNDGAHALYLDGVLARTLRGWGIDPPGGSPPLGDYWAIADGSRTRFPASAPGLAATKLLSARGKLAFAKLQLQLNRLQPDDLAGRTVGDWIADHPADVRKLILSFVRLTSYSNAPDQMDAGAAIAQLKLGARGVRYVDGGWSRIADDLRGRLGRLGATVRPSSPVTSVAATGDGTIRIAGPDETLSARAVVLATGGPDTAARLLGIDTPETWRTLPVEASCLDVWTSTPPAGSVIIDLDRDLYASVHAPVAALAPQGVTLLSVLHYLPVGEGPASPADERALLLDHACRAGIAESSVLGMRYLHRMTVAHGMPLASQRGELPHVDSAGIAGVTVAGDWVGGGGLLADASAGSGLAAAESAVSAATSRRAVAHG